ncbi:hypothetical protein RJ639_034891 [Escallonia herrerae]|uniref:F-box domain-containing protein n=1 Tax=Escallonia herrerae TaxID=1293975 RepID=A0AA88WT85_9ASTE|nr:hypothetical protein RJ639_034891 [Escallonia herrerae]
MADLPDELWRRVLELGIETSKLNHKDLCCLSISSTRFNRLSTEDALWSALLSSDFPIAQSSSSLTFNHQPPNSSSKSLYRIRQKLLSHKRAVLRMESQIAVHSRKLQHMQLQLAKESEKMKATLAELSNLRKARQASVALNVWQPEVIRGRQKQIVEQCNVPVDCRINALEMELKLCKQQAIGFDKAHRNEKRRLDVAKTRLASLNYHPLHDHSLRSSSFDERGVKRKKFNKTIHCEAPILLLVVIAINLLHFTCNYNMLFIVLTLIFFRTLYPSSSCSNTPLPQLRSESAETP